MSFLSTYGLVRGPSTPVFESPLPNRKPDSTPNSAKNKTESKESRVKVVVRSRPILPGENGEKCESIIDLNEPEGQVIVALEKTFAFDSCFSSDVTQQDIYTNVTANIVQDFARNVENNATILAYGQTGAGKTYTMLGNREENGIIQRSLKDVFRLCDPETDSIGIAFYEIYNEKVFDLLSQSSLKVPLLLREENGGEFYLPQLKHHWTGSFDEALELLDKGLKTRSIGSTASNENSSRSHAIFRVTIARMSLQNDCDEQRKEAKLSLVDLAGSESVKKTKAVGERLAEANNINKGLLALGSCVSDICRNNKHIPFRNSTLTKVLRECLHGEGHTCMIACVSPTEADLSETMNTLRYADRAKSMQKPPVPKHLLQISNSAKKRKFASLSIPPTPGKILKLNKTVEPLTLSSSKRVNTPSRMNATVGAFSSTAMKKVPTFSVPSFSESLENISESEEESLTQSKEEESMSEISTIYPPSSTGSSVLPSISASKITSELSRNNMTVLDASVLSPMIRRVLQEQQDQFMNRLEQTLLQQKTKTPNKSSPKNLRHSPRLCPKIDESLLADETLISGPAFSESRQKMRATMDENPKSEDMMICKSLLRDVTNVDKMRRKSAHKEAVEKTASPSFCTKELKKSLEGKENDEVSRMAKEMGIDSPLLMFGDEDDFDNNTQRTSTVRKKSVKRSVRRTTMLPPELSKTLNETFKDRRRSSRLEALDLKFKNPLEVKSNWQVFDQEKHNANILTMVNTANLQMLQKIPAIGPKTAFMIHSHRELHGKFDSLDILKAIPGLQKSFFNKFTKTHQVVL